ncbi:LysR substrate-binding domain-containing protein [Streptomyces sp. LHD-70]|uniref:LysR substrate-binding domain-containing protein n=1 Tax=Streptomyces sp. LHD-70 TaxID=3072140 RepID=UPI00280CB52C|nr:LysR substrate-binding domain-containing protein [Streptomyces sp. LHD-70]MDQ8705356.1 LysR substrate-binding domain-containing protein [Streptomyces sp. LHD-70]
MLKPLHLLTLRAVVSSGSFALAARELGYTASAISQQISALEKESGLVLFEREAHGIRPTSAAHRLVDLSTRALAALDDLTYQVEELASGATGRLRLGAFPTAGVRLVPSALSALSDTHPRARIELQEGEPEELVGALGSGDLDVALVYEYGLSPCHWPEGLARHPLLREDLILLRAQGSALSPQLAQLSGARWITSREDTAGARSLARLCAAAGFDATVAFRSNNYDVVRELVSARLGVAVVPALGHVPSAAIEATRLTQRSAHRRVMALHRAENSNPLLATMLVALRQAVPVDVPYLHPAD